MIVFTVTTEDRQTGVTVEVWREKDRAIARATEIAQLLSRSNQLVIGEEEDSFLPSGGWRYRVVYGVEGCSVTVKEQEVRE